MSAGAADPDPAGIMRGRDDSAGPKKSKIISEKKDFVHKINIM